MQNQQQLTEYLDRESLMQLWYEVDIYDFDDVVHLM